MNDFDPASKKASTTKNKIEQVQKKKQEYRLIGKIVPRKGMKLYEYNPKKDILQQVEVLPEKFMVVNIKARNKKQPNVTRYQSYVDPNCIYYEALNYNSALKRLNKFKAGKIKKLTNIRIKH